MDDQKVLQHLLDLEAQAAALVDDAQREADRRISEGEKQNRSDYDEIYSREVQALEESYNKKLAVIKEDYQKQMDACRESLKVMSLNTAGFSSLVEKYLLDKGP